MGALLDEAFPAIRCDVTNPGADVAAQLSESLSAADIVIDASASVAVSRHLADLPGVQARRLCTFFNPAGTAVVLLAESADRRVTLRDLEAQYHDLLLSDPGLADHLRVNQPGLRYSGSCRALTNRIPATHAALLSSLAARGISDCLGKDQSAIRIWTLSEQGEVHLVQRPGAAVTKARLASWDITYDEGVLRTLAGHRERRLPRETGGVLLGIIDVSRRSIYVAHALPQPEDSVGSVAGFERGVVGLSDVISRVAQASLYQLRYVGEWHSHPRGASAWPSQIDLAQLAWLGDELEAEGVPALMAIAADDGAFSFMIRDNTRTEHAEPARRRGGLA
jgi:proteasome lid subunit RPN8/RPN11